MDLAFRAWDICDKKMHTLLVIDWLNRLVDLDSGKVERSFDNVKLMQYMDLKDKNGRIYCQDDLVLYKGKIYRLIKGTYMFELSGFFETSQDIQGDFFSEGAYQDGEIVSNIYEFKKEQLDD